MTESTPGWHAWLISCAAACAVATVASVAPAAVPQNPEFVIHRPSNTGIPGQSDVIFATQGPDGRLYVAARDQFWLQGGLGIFDGTQWTTYANWQTPLPEWNYDIAFAADGSYWLAGDEQVTHVTADGQFNVYDAANSPLLGNRNWAVEVDNLGHVWVVNDSVTTIEAGLYEFDGQNWLPHSEPWMQNEFGIADPIEIFAHSNGEVWASFDAMPGTAVWDGQFWTHYPSWPQFLGAAELSNGNVVLVNGLGEFEVDLTTRQSTQFGTHQSSTVFVDTLDRVWIASREASMFYEDGFWSTFTIEPSRISSIEVRENGDVWLTTKHQVRHYAPNGVGIRIYNSVNTGMPEYLMSGAYCDRDGQMWFTAPEAGISLLDGVEYRNFGIYNGDEEQWAFWDPGNQGSLCEGVESVVHAQDGSIWLAANGVARSQKSDLQNWDLWYWGNSSLPSGFIRHIVEDGDGRIWVGHDYGVQYYDGQDWPLHQFSGTYTGNDIRAMTVDTEGRVWVGASSGEIHRSSGTTWTSMGFVQGVGTAAAAPDGSVWFGGSNGLVRFSGGGQTTYTPANSGLTEGWVSAVAVRDDGLVAAHCQDLFNFPYSGSLVFFDGTTWATFIAGEPGGPPHHQTHDLEFDAEGDLWAINVNNGGVEVKLAAPPLPGDLNADGTVNNQDLGILLAGYLACDGDAAFNPDADLTGDGCVNNQDLGVLLANYLRTQ